MKIAELFWEESKFILGYTHKQAIYLWLAIHL